MRSLRFVFCTTPGIYSAVVLEELARSPHLHLAGVVASSRILRKNGRPWWDALLLMRKTGLRYAGYLWMVTTGYRLLAPPGGSSLSLSPKAWAAAPRHVTRDINRPECIGFIRECAPDFLLSAHFNQLIGSELLALPPLGCLNIHPGKLPEFRGVDPAFQALLRGEQSAGVTLHYQDEQFDTGAVVATAQLPVSASDSLVSLNCSLFRAGAGLLCASLSQEGLAREPRPQEGAVRYDSWPDPRSVRQVRRAGRSLADIRFLLKKSK